MRMPSMHIIVLSRVAWSLMLIIFARVLVMSQHKRAHINWIAGTSTKPDSSSCLDPDLNDAHYLQVLCFIIVPCVKECLRFFLVTTE